MLAEEVAIGAEQNAFASPLGTTQGDSNANLLARVLHTMRHPFQQVVKVFRVARAHPVMDVCFHTRPVAGLGFNAEAAPEIEQAWPIFGARCEHLSLIHISEPTRLG